MTRTPFCWLVAMCVSGAAQAQEVVPSTAQDDAQQVPDGPAPPPIELTPIEPPALDYHPDGLKTDAMPVPTSPKPDAPQNFFSAPVWGGLVGCTVGGGLPAAGAVVGALTAGSALSSGANVQSCGEALSTFACASSGILLAAGSLVTLGPCSSCGACAGASIAATLGNRPVIPIVLGSVPGMVVGGLSPILLYASLASANTTGPAVPTTPLFITGVALGILAGPVTWAGAGMADAFFGDEETDATPPALTTTPEPRQTTTAAAAMAF